MSPGRSKYISASKIQSTYDISSATLRNWAESGRLDAIRLDGGKRLYNAESLDRLLLSTTQQEEKAKRGAIYCRVSSQHQKEDLERQIKDMQKDYPEHELFSDIASGLNWQRKGLKAILDKVYNGHITEIVVAHRDRLCRFGFELIEYFCQKSDCKIVVQRTRSDEQTTNTYNELAEDLLAVTNYFVAKNNGLRSARNRKERREKERTGARDSAPPERAGKGLDETNGASKIQIDNTSEGGEDCWMQET
jgi:predicted site-specific integrase-resolvase